MASPSGATAALQAAANQLAGTLTNLSSAVAATTASFGQAAAQAGQGAATIGQSLQSAAGPLLAVANSLGAGLGAMAGRILDLVVPGLGTLAETLINLPQRLLAAVTPFVEALNPALLLAFNQQMANLQATVGTAFQNIFTILAPVLDQMAALIQSTMDALRPVVDSLVQMFGTYLVEVTRNFVTQMKALMPIIEVLMSLLQATMAILEVSFAILRPIIEYLGFLLKMILMPLNVAMSIFNKAMEGLNKILDVVSTVFSTVIDILSEMLDTLFESLGLGSLFDVLQEGIKYLITAILALAGFLYKLLGLDINKLIENLTGKPHAIAAPKDVAFKGIEQITRDIAAASFIAGAGTEKTQEDLLKDGIEVLKLIRDDRLDFKTWLQDQMNMLTSAIIVALEKVGGEKADKFVQDHPAVGGAGQAGAVGLGALTAGPRAVVDWFRGK